MLAELLFDNLLITIAPFFFGRNGVRAMESLDCSLSSSCLTNVMIEQFVDDIVVWGTLAHDDSDH